MSDSSPLQLDLNRHRDLCQQLLAIVERENQALRQPESSVGLEYFQKKNLLPSLIQSLNRIRQHRVDRQQQDAQERVPDVHLASLLRQTQDLIMKIIVLDRENEQALLRKGLVPARHLPPANRQRPHFVADLYRRQTDAVGPQA
jgi:hypothetical protein